MEGPPLLVFKALLTAGCIVAASTAAVAQDDPERFDMRRIYHELDLAYQKAKRMHSVSLDLTPAYDACVSRSADKDHCRQVANELSERLEEKVHRAQMLEEEKKQTDLLREQSARSEEERNTAITIYDNTNPYDYPYYRPTPPWFVTPRPRPTPFPRPRPGFKPQNRFQAGDGFDNPSP